MIFSFDLLLASFSSIAQMDVYCHAPRTAYFKSKTFKTLIFVAVIWPRQLLISATIFLNLWLQPLPTPLSFVNHLLFSHWFRTTAHWSLIPCRKTAIKTSMETRVIIAHLRLIQSRRTAIMMVWVMLVLKIVTLMVYNQYFSAFIWDLLHINDHFSSFILYC